MGAAGSIVAKGGTVSKLPMRGTDTRINNIGISTSTGRSVIDVAGRSGVAVGDGSQAPGSAVLSSQSTLLLSDIIIEMHDVVWLDAGDLEWKVLVSNHKHLKAIEKRGGAIRNSLFTYIGVGLDLLDGLLIEITSIGVPALDVVRLLNTSSVTLAQRAAVNIADPAQMRIDIDSSTRLERDDELAGDNLGLDSGSGGRGESGREQSSEIESKTEEASHCANEKSLMKLSNLFVQMNEDN